MIRLTRGWGLIEKLQRKTPPYKYSTLSDLRLALSATNVLPTFCLIGDLEEKKNYLCLGSRKSLRRDYAVHISEGKP